MQRPLRIQHTNKETYSNRIYSKLSLATESVMAGGSTYVFVPNADFELVRRRNRRRTPYLVVIAVILSSLTMFGFEKKLIDDILRRTTRPCPDSLLDRVSATERHESGQDGSSTLTSLVKENEQEFSKTVKTQSGALRTEDKQHTVFSTANVSHVTENSVPAMKVEQFGIAEVLVVVLAIPDYPWYAGLAKESHEQYAVRHGYRLIVQRSFQGPRSGHHKRASSLQKLLACQYSRGERYVLILDYDVVIAPWAPAVHLDEKVKSEMGPKVGIVDESQPSAEHVEAILKLRTGEGRDPSDYYARLGFPGVNASRGILNTGVMLVQPEVHGKMFQSLFYKHVERQKKHSGRFHYEQALIGAELMRARMDGTLHHTWNRGWVWYNWSEAAGFEKYEIGDVFRRTYFMHFLWAKNDIFKLRQWMKDTNVTFNDNHHLKLLA